MSVVKFNVNHSCMARLNDDGVEIYENWCKDRGLRSSPSLNTNNELRGQLWRFLLIFGPHIGMLAGSGFKNNELFLLLEGTDEIFDVNILGEF